MPELIIWKNQEMNRLRQDIHRMFARVWEDFGMPHLPAVAGGPTSIEVTEKKDHVVVRMEIPGIDPENLELSVSENDLTVSGSLRRETTSEEENVRRTKRTYESFSRNLKLPCRVTPQEARANFCTNTLEIILPKAAFESSRRIAVQLK